MHGRDLVAGVHDGEQARECLGRGVEQASGDVPHPRRAEHIEGACALALRGFPCEEPIER